MRIAQISTTTAAALASSRELRLAWEESEARVIRDLVNESVYSLDSLYEHIDGGGLLLASASQSPSLSSAWSVEALAAGSIEKALDSGSTLVVNGISETEPSIAELARTVSNALVAPVSVNAYATKPNVKVAAPRHFDAQDVLALQVSGSQNWHLWNDDEEKETIQVKTGDLVYIPAFSPHATDTLGLSSSHHDISFHLTIGLDWVAFALDDPALPGKALSPPGILSSPSSTASALAGDTDLGVLYSDHAIRILKAQHKLHSDVRPNNWAQRFQEFWAEVTPAVLAHRRAARRPDASPIEDDDDYLEEARLATKLYTDAKLRSAGRNHDR